VEKTDIVRSLILSKNRLESMTYHNPANVVYV